MFPPSSGRRLIDSDNAAVVGSASHHSRNHSIPSGIGDPQSFRNLQCFVNADSGSVTYASQGKLPRLPIPDLQESLEKFKQRLVALETDCDRAETDRVVQEFLDSDGPSLQDALRNYEKEGREEERIGVSSSAAYYRRSFDPQNY